MILQWRLSTKIQKCYCRCTIANERNLVLLFMLFKEIQACIRIVNLYQPFLLHRIGMSLYQIDWSSVHRLLWRVIRSTGLCVHAWIVQSLEYRLLLVLCPGRSDRSRLSVIAQHSWSIDLHLYGTRRQMVVPYPIPCSGKRMWLHEWNNETKVNNWSRTVGQTWLANRDIFSGYNSPLRSIFRW